MIDGRMLLLGHRLVAPADPFRIARTERLHELSRRRNDPGLIARRDEERLRGRRRATQPFARLHDELRVIPPETRIEGDVRVEELRLDDEGLDDEETRERFADDRALFRRA